MKKLLFTTLLGLFSLTAQAQFTGGFYYDDPDALFDKEPYFYCYNNYTYNGWGQNIQNVRIVINGTDVYSYPYVWGYGTFIRLGRENGVDYSSGDVVSIYWGNQFIDSWVYSSKSILSEVKIKGGRRTGEALKKASKKVWKYMKKAL